jgi:hypothetical protein
MTEAPTTQEQYACAIHSMSLRVEAGRQGDADLLIAAGWSKSRFGAVMMRLHSEWDSAERRGCRIPRKPNRKQISLKAQEIARHARAETVEQVHSDQAKAEMAAAYEQELKETMRALKSLPAARLHLSIKLAMDGCQSAEEMAAAVLLHWLHPTCPACCGRKFQLLKWSEDELSDQACGGCGGSGQAPVPGGEAGKAGANYIDDCVGIARQSIRDKLRHTR